MQIVTPSIKISPPKAKSRLSPPAFCFLIFCFVHGLLIVTLPIVHEFCIFPPQSSCIIIIAEGKPLQDNNSIHKISPPKAKSRLSPPAFCFIYFSYSGSTLSGAMPTSLGALYGSRLCSFTQRSIFLSPWHANVKGCVSSKGSSIGFPQTIAYLLWRSSSSMSCARTPTAQSPSCSWAAAVKVTPQSTA